MTTAAPRLLLSLAVAAHLVVALSCSSSPDSGVPASEGDAGAAGDDGGGRGGEGDGGQRSEDAGDGGSPAADAGTIDPDSGTPPGSGDGGTQVTCNGAAATCSEEDPPCIADYGTAGRASAWCTLPGTADSRISEHGAACGGFDVVTVSTNVVGSSTTFYYDATSGALVATLRTDLNTNHGCTSTLPSVPLDPCGDDAVVTTCE